MKIVLCFAPSEGERLFLESWGNVPLVRDPLTQFPRSVRCGQRLGFPVEVFSMSLAEDDVNGHSC